MKVYVDTGNEERLRVLWQVLWMRLQPGWLSVDSDNTEVGVFKLWLP